MEDSLAINVLSLNPKIANLVLSEQFLDYPYKRGKSFDFFSLHVKLFEFVYHFKLSLI